jgi:hypothetical protein
MSPRGRCGQEHNTSDFPRDGLRPPAGNPQPAPTGSRTQERVQYVIIGSGRCPVRARQSIPRHRLMGLRPVPQWSQRTAHRHPHWARRDTTGSRPRIWAPIAPASPIQE